MARKQAELQKKVMELNESKSEATKKIQDRISKGHTLKALQMINFDTYKSVQREVDKWDNFNDELLKRLFTTPELSDEYNSWTASIFGSFSGPTLQDEIRVLSEHIDERVHCLDSILDRLELISEVTSVSQEISPPPKPALNINQSKIFVVHGHDDVAKLEVARFLDKMGFEAIILHEQASGNKTIIEKIEAYTDVGFGVVIYTPCDQGGKNEESVKFQGRARQNVVFENGFLIGKLGRDKVCQLVKGEVEQPNDISGIVYTPMEGNWQVTLAKELREAGYAVDMNKVV